MATYVYGSYQSVSGYGFKFRSWFAYDTSQTATTYSVTLYAGAQLTGNTGTVKMNLNCSVAGTGQTTKSTTTQFNTGSMDSSKRQTLISTWTWTWNKGTSAANKTISCTVNRSGMSNSTVSQTFTVPALASYAVSYNANGGEGSIANQTKYYGTNITLSDGTGFSRSHYTLTGWNTAADGSGTAYGLGAIYSANSAITLYAQWELDAIVTKVKVGGAWYEGIIYAKVNGAWVIPFAGYTKVNGSWEEITP